MSFSPTLARQPLHQTPTYLPYVFEGEAWTDAQKKRVIAHLHQYVPAWVPPTFNKWHFFQLEPDHYLVMRTSYERGNYYASLNGVLAELEGEYGPALAPECRFV
jgi:hypothetical protein